MSKNIDPPFNTEGDGFKYNDKFNHSTWLTFMKNRMTIASRLLSHDGLILVHVDINESHYLKVLMDEVFGRDNFLNEIIWCFRERETSTRFFNKKHNNILFYAKDKLSNYKFYNERIREEYSEITVKKFKYTDEEGRKYRLRTKDGDSDPAVEDENTYRQYLDPSSGPLPRDWFVLPFLNQSSSERVGFNTQKPEELLKKFILAMTDEKDLVLDYHAGSGTTAAVAHKMNRQYIVVEQMDYIEEITLERLKKVLEGEQGGISKDVGWQGGGSFVYCELKENAQELIDIIQNANEDNVSYIKNEIYNDKRIVPYLTSKELVEADKDFEALSLEDKKKALVKLIDKNKLYVNYSDIDNADFDISEDEKMFTRSFYEVGLDE